MRIATARGTDGPVVDRSDLAEVIGRLHPRMVAAAARVLRDDEEARDAVQDAYAQAVCHLHRFDGRAELSTWLHRIVVNAALMRLRARRRRPAEALDELAIVDDAADVEATVQRRQIQALVRRSLARLPGNHRTVLDLRDMRDGEPALVARMLGVTPGALKTRALRARHALRAHLVQIGIRGDGSPRLRAPITPGRSAATASGAAPVSRASRPRT